MLGSVSAAAGSCRGGHRMFAGAPSAALGRRRGTPSLASLPLLRSREPLHRRHERCKQPERGGMYWKGARCSVLMAGEGQPPTSTITGNHDPLCMQGLVQSVQLPRHHGEVETPTSNQPPHGTQGRRLLGPAALRSCPFASLHGQARARLGPGGYYRHFGNGGPQTCLPAACGVAQKGAQRGPSSPTQTQDPRGADDAKLPQARPRQAGSRGGGEIKAGYLTRCP